MLSITLKQIEFFITVVETESFSKAAEKLKYSQSNVSGVISQLEELMNVQLLDRTNKKSLVLTEEGRVFYTKAKEIVSNCYTLENISCNSDSNSVSIGAHNIPAQYMLADLITFYKTRDRNARFQLRESDDFSIVNMLNTHQIDLGIILSDDSANVQNCIPIYEDKIVIGMPNLPRYRNILQRGSSVRDVLLNEHVIWNQSVEDYVNDYLATIGLTKDDLTIISEVNSEQLVKTCVINGMGISFMSRISMKCALKSAEMLLYEPYNAPSRRINVLTQETAKNNACTRFISFLQSGEFDFEKCLR